MADQVLTKYGPLDIDVAAVVRQQLERRTCSVLVPLTEAHLTLIELDKCEKGDGAADSPSCRWRQLMVELFGERQSDLLEWKSTSDATHCAARPRSPLDEPEPHVRVVRNVLSTVCVFLVAEANTTRCRLTRLMKVKGVDRTMLDEFDELAVDVLTYSVTLHRHATDGSWSEMFFPGPEHRNHPVAQGNTHLYARSVMHGDQRRSPGFERALERFCRVARRVPAYRDFLAENGIRAASVRTPEAFAEVPVVTRQNYLDRYPLDALMWDGDLAAASIWSTASSSVGPPLFWPRSETASDDSIEVYERVFRQAFQSHRRSTLFIVGFAMGSWVGGTYSLQAALALRERGHHVSVVTPGIDSDSLLNCLDRLAPHYEQTVLAGYPSFLKHVLDQAHGDLRARRIRILLAGEGITEDWRSYMLARLGPRARPDCVSVLYVTAATGPIGHETPATIKIRRLARNNRALAAALSWDASSPPTFVEYNPNRCYIETLANGSLLFSIDSAIPLVRYRSNDAGSITTTDELAHALGKNARILDSSCHERGFVSVRGRTDDVTLFYAVKIHSESVQDALRRQPLANRLSGRFQLTTEVDASFEQSLRLRVEVQPGKQMNHRLRTEIRDCVTAKLKKTNREYNWLHTTLGARAEPAVTLHPYGTLTTDTQHIAASPN
ncbi:hypothetical protein CRH09_14965 [Nocardia terpenica]|uniref:Phenylacetate--CoA ligase family protein n=2 Tax=Nocardia terpenica TaxID=455432 RepID=A0A291RJ10_9NOCA|nr:hypothetical protein CRH09_14965 [Nocardia terpenica]